MAPSVATLPRAQGPPRSFVPRQEVGFWSTAACGDIPEIPVRNSGILEIIRDFLLAGLSRVILP